MIREFTLPDVGEGVAEGELVSWLVEPGEAVVEDQPVAEVETDKALVEIPSPYDGTVAELRADPGDVVPVGDVIVTFDVPEDGEAEGEGRDEAAAGSGEGESSDDEPETRTGTEAGTGTRAGVGAGSGGGGGGEPRAADEQPEPDAGRSVERGEDGTGDATRVFAPPSVRRLARELGVDLAAVIERVADGRPSEADVRAYAEGGPAVGDSKDANAEPAPEPAEGDETRRGAVTRRNAGGSGGTAGTSGTDGTDGSRGATRPPVGSADRDRTLAVPATRRVARQEGVDIDAVPTDRTREGEAFVTAEQVREYAARTGEESGEAAEQAAVREPAEPTEAAGEPEPEPEPAERAEPADPDGTTAGTDEPAGTADATGATGDGHAGDGPAAGGTVAYRGIRRTIGERMVESARTAAHVTHHDTAEVSALVDARERLTPRAEERGVRLTYLPFVMKAVVAGLEAHPIVNARLRGTDGGEGGDGDREIALLDEYHLGVAVATDAGLLVPVVEDVDRKGLFELARETRDLAERARDRELTPAEMRGGTFTLTNFGAIGGEYATPIINRPESAILGLGAIEERPVAADGAVVARPTLPLSLSIDHRVIDGADAARFTNDVIERLEAPVRLLE